MASARLDEMAWKNIGIIRSLKDREYAQYVLEARKNFLALRLRHEPAIRKIYIDTADSVAAQLRTLKPSIGELTKSHLKTLEKTLRTEAEKIQIAQEALIKDGMRQAIQFGSAPLDKHLIKSIQEAGIPLNVLKLQRGFGDVNTAAVEALWARTIKEMKVSDRIWKNTQRARDNMLNVVRTGLASGRDAAKVAKDLEKYVRDGAKSLAEDYPKMMARFAKNMPEWAKKAGFYRIPKDLVYEALRLARTEYSNAFFEGTYSRGRVNPSYQGVRFMLSDSHPDPDVCDALAEADYYGLGKGVYKKGQEPKHPHPNCLCFVIAYLMDTEEFANDLVKWKENPESVGYLNEWYENIYNPLVGTSYKPVKEIVTKRVFQPAKTIREATTRAKENDLANVVNWSGAKVEIANEWNKAIWETQQQFPKLREQFEFIGTIQNRNKYWYEKNVQRVYEKLIKDYPNYSKEYLSKKAKRFVVKPKVSGNVYAQSVKGDSLTNGITVNLRFAKNIDEFKNSLAYDVSSKFHPVGCNTLRSVVDHELGHQIDDLLQISNDIRIKKLYDSLMYDEIKQKLSGYAAKNIREFVAEAWSEWKNNSNPRPLALEVYNVIMDLTKKKGGN